LEARLVGDGMALHSDGLGPPRVSGAGVLLDTNGAAVAVEEGARTKRLGFLKRRINPPGDLNSEGEGGRQRVGAVQSSGSVAPGRVRVKADVQEISMRVVTEMGLYDSRTGPAVVVQVDIG